MRYFTVKEGALVSRFGTPSYLGAVLSVEQTGPKKGQTRLEWTKGEVVALSDEELTTYGREYTQLVAEGSLIDSTEEAFLAYSADQAKASGADEAATLNAKLEAAKAAHDRLLEEAKQAQERLESALAERKSLEGRAEKLAAASRSAPADPEIIAAPSAPTETEPKTRNARSKE